VFDVSSSHSCGAVVVEPWLAIEPVDDCQSSGRIGPTLSSSPATITHLRTGNGDRLATKCGNHDRHDDPRRTVHVPTLAQSSALART
jgi:hypothetical protein